MYRMYREVTYEAPCVMWYIKGTKNNIIIDLGPPDPEQSLKNYGWEIKRSKKQEPLNALKSIPLSPDDVKIVIVTHLHWDHTGGFHLFKNAKFLIQRKEMEYAIAPLPSHRPIYYGKDSGKPTFVDYLHKIEVRNGDYEVEDGVTAVSIPGHTPGFQGVLVRTEKGKYIIAADAVGLYECWDTVPHVPTGIFRDLEQCYESMDKIERIADYVLPGHDGKVFDKAIYP
jgi:N-acyl homoserine lactone hydrolase